MSWRRHTWRSDKQLRNAMLLFALTGPLSHVLCVVPVSVCSRVVLNVQVYNETLRDLLAPAGTGRNAPGRTLEHASIKHDASGGRMEATLPPPTSWWSKAAQPVAQSCSSLGGCLDLATAPIAAAGGGTQVTGATRVVIGAADDAEEVMRRAAAARACEVCPTGRPASQCAHVSSCTFAGMQQLATCTEHRVERRRPACFVIVTLCWGAGNSNECCVLTVALRADATYQRPARRQRGAPHRCTQSRRPSWQVCDTVSLVRCRTHLVLETPV